MKTIGLLGGITCESSLVYYRLVNEMTRARLGGNHSARSVMVSVDFQQVQPLTERGDWDQVLAIMTGAAKAVERGGADFLLICANTIHRLAGGIGREIGIPILHIVDATATEIRKAGLDRIGLLGTRFTMEEDFFRGRLRDRHGIETLTPGPEGRRRVHRIIIDELAAGVVRPESRAEVWRIIDDLEKRGARGVILGCTELPLLVTQERDRLPLFDTLTIHAAAAVERALADGPG